MAPCWKRQNGSYHLTRAEQSLDLMICLAVPFINVSALFMAS